MLEPEQLDFWACTTEILNRMRPGGGGVLCTVADQAGKQNLLTLGWGQIGPSYHDHPVFIIAVAPPRYSWRFLQTPVHRGVETLPNGSLGLWTVIALR